jgi:hypothetical protein
LTRGGASVGIVKLVYHQERHPLLRAINIADLPVIALRIAHVASWRDLSAEWLP